MIKSFHIGEYELEVGNSAIRPGKIVYILHRTHGCGDPDKIFIPDKESLNDLINVLMIAADVKRTEQINKPPEPELDRFKELDYA